MFNKYIFDYARKAKSISYGALRKRTNVKGLVLHYTGNKGDTAKNNADYFATSNTRSAGAHIFIDGKGLSARSIPLDRIAYSVGNPKNAYKRGGYYSTLSNANTVSIELCDIVDHAVTKEQMAELIRVAKWVKKKCPNIEYVVRHFDIVQKDCPAWYVSHQKEWLKLQLAVYTAITQG